MTTTYPFFNTIAITDLFNYIEDINRMTTKNLNDILRDKGKQLSENGDNSIWCKRQILLKYFIDNYREPFSNDPMSYRFWDKIRSCVSELPSNTRSLTFRNNIENMREAILQTGYN